MAFLRPVHLTDFNSIYVHTPKSKGMGRVYRDSHRRQNSSKNPLLCHSFHIGILMIKRNITQAAFLHIKELHKQNAHKAAFPSPWEYY